MEVGDLLDVRLVDGLGQILPQEHQRVDRVRVRDFLVVLLSYQIFAVAKDVVARRLRQLEARLDIGLHDEVPVANDRVEDKALGAGTRVRRAFVNH